MDRIIFRKYHLSYDAIGLNDKYTSNDARIEILKVLKKMGVTSVQSPCNSTIIFDYKDSSFDFDTFEMKLDGKFFYSICLVAENKDKKPFHKLKNSTNISDFDIQKDWKSIE